MAPIIKKLRLHPPEEFVAFDAGSSRQRTAAAQRVEANRKRVLRAIRDLGFKDEKEALQLALISMLAGYQQALVTLPDKSVARALVEGAFGAAPTLAQRLLAGE